MTIDVRVIAELAVLQRVVMTYGDGALAVHALRGVDLSLRAGEFVVVLGPSGSGKTTLLNLLGAIESPTAGFLSVAGSDLATMSAEERTTFRRDGVGFVFQFFNLIPSLTARENVELVLELTGRAGGGRAEQHLAAVGLGDRLDNSRRSCRAGSSSGWRSPGRWPRSLRCCCATNRRARSISTPPWWSSA